MQDRGYIKWAPFNSVMNGDKIIKEINKEKSKINKPTLSEDQTEFINEKIFEAYTNHLKVNLYIYKNENIEKIIGFINNINIPKKYITFNNNYIYFNQIINISNFF